MRYIADAGGKNQLMYGSRQSFIAACGDFQDCLPLVKEKRVSVVEPSEGESISPLQSNIVVRLDRTFLPVP